MVKKTKLQIKELITLAISQKHLLRGGGFLVFAIVFGNVLNYFFNAYLSRNVEYSYIALVSLIGSFLYLTRISLHALGTTVNFKSGFLVGRYGQGHARAFWIYIRKRISVIAIGISLLWLALSPLMVSLFKTNDIYPFVFFSAVLLIGFTQAVDKGYLMGGLMFGAAASILLLEPVIKLLSTVILVNLGAAHLTHISIPLSVVGAFILGSILVNRIKTGKKSKIAASTYHFPKKYFLVAVISGLSSNIFLSLDIVLANLFLSHIDAGKYTLLALAGKMIYFSGGLPNQFIIPLVSRSEGANKDSKKTFYTILFFTSVLSIASFMVIGPLGGLTVPILWGEKALAIVPYLLFFSFGMLCFAISRVFETYYLTKRIYTFTFVSFALAIVQTVLISINHRDLDSLVWAMVITGILNLVFMVLLHLFIGVVRSFERNLGDLADLFFGANKLNLQDSKRNILIFNWRDTKHVWAGGAEVYIHEIAKKWVKEGNNVVLFCGNDGTNLRNQVIDGVTVMRRGGTYAVYIWAFLYYVLRLRNKFDVIVDSENGIPFFTPFYVRAPVVLLIHHIHQEIHRRHLSFPFSNLAIFLEGTLMPFVYKENAIITVSESSKREILNLGLGRKEEIELVHPGVDGKIFKKARKTAHPSFLYLGRIKPYKKINVAIRAFAKVLATYPLAQLTIAGEGENRGALKKLAGKLGISKSVHFPGKVTQARKIALFAQSWVMLAPSSMEGWGITVIEANACATPVVASRVNGLRDSIVHGKTGLLVKEGDISAFATAMIKLVANRRLREKLSKGAHIWSQKFYWDDSANRFYNVLAEASGREKRAVRLSIATVRSKI